MASLFLRARRTIPTLSKTLRTCSTDRPLIPIDNAPGWCEELATPSEASVKADRTTTPMDEMRKKTVDYAQSHQRDPDGERTHATYAREEISGPLGNARVGEFEGVVGNDDLGPDDQVEPNGRVVSRHANMYDEIVHEGKPSTNG